MGDGSAVPVRPFAGQVLSKGSSVGDGTFPQDLQRFWDGRRDLQEPSEGSPRAPPSRHTAATSRGECSSCRTPRGISQLNS